MKLSDVIARIVKQIDAEGDLDVNSFEINDEFGITQWKGSYSGRSHPAPVEENSKFYFVQLACFDNFTRAWFDEHGVVEVTSDYAIYQGHNTNHFEVWKSLNDMQEDLGSKFVKLTELQ